MKEEILSNLIKNFTFDNFVVNETNRYAYEISIAVAKQPGFLHNPLVIYGKSGLGKTHLLHAIGNYIKEYTNKKVLYVTSEMFMNDFIKITNLTNEQSSVDYASEFQNKYYNVDVLIIDDIQYLANSGKIQEEFFHIFNVLHRGNKQMIISSDRRPDDLKILNERLISRFMWGEIVNIDSSDNVISLYEHTSPFEFLKYKYNHGEPTKRDICLIESLLINQKLQPPVVNVLIDYVLKTDDNKLNKSYVETIAGHWKRSNIETTQEALNLIEKEQTKSSKKVKKVKESKTTEPTWFNENIQKENMTEEETKELEGILSKYK